MAANPKVETEWTKLTDTAGFDLSKEPQLSRSGLVDVLKELDEEDKVAAKVKAREVLIKLRDLKRKMTAARREFDKQEKKFGDELLGMLGRINRVLSGEPDTTPAQQGQAPADPPVDPPATPAT